MGMPCAACAVQGIPTAGFHQSLDPGSPPAARPLQTRFPSRVFQHSFALPTSLPPRYVRKVGLIIIDEIHLLGADRCGGGGRMGDCCVCVFFRVCVCCEDLLSLPPTPPTTHTHAPRGPILEVIVSRMRYVAAEVGRSVRFVGLSTALANAQVRRAGGPAAIGWGGAFSCHGHLSRPRLLGV